jgi:pimeloyl-ACP methyl ester carboxylesterase
VHLNIGDVKLFFDVEGLGWTAEETALHPRPVIVLVHGGPGTNDHSHYKPTLSALTDTAQLIYYDHRGNGRSGRSEPAKWNLAQWGEDLKAFCDALGLERPIVLGTSFGGFVAQSYATRYPDHPGKLILCSTSSRMRFDRAFEAMERMGGPRARAVAEKFWCGGDPAAVTRDYIEACCPLYSRMPLPASASIDAEISRTVWNNDVMRHFTGQGGEAHHFNFLSHLKRIRCPTLVLHGEDDPITTITDAEEMVAALPAALVRFERFPHCGHPTFGDAPLRTFRIIREFIRS